MKKVQYNGAADDGRGATVISFLALGVLFASGCCRQAPPEPVPPPPSASANVDAPAAAPVAAALAPAVQPPPVAGSVSEVQQQLLSVMEELQQAEVRAREDDDELRARYNRMVAARQAYSARLGEIAEVEALTTKRNDILRGQAMAEQEARSGAQGDQ